MPRCLHVIRDPALDGPTNMARDEHLLYSTRLRPAAVRIYAWDPPTISLGYFQRWAALADLPPDVRDLAVVRRPTGGGAILHDREVTYCLVVDDSLPVTRQSPLALYRLAHECWRLSVDRPTCPVALAPDSFPMPTPRTGPFFCFERPGRTDLVIVPESVPGAPAPERRDRNPADEPISQLGAGRSTKLLGSAQRRLPGRVLQHGSLLLGRRFASHPGADLGDPPADTVAAWIAAFLNRLAAALNLAPCPADWLPGELADVAARRVQYASAAWTRRR